MSGARADGGLGRVCRWCEQISTTVDEPDPVGFFERTCGALEDVRHTRRRHATARDDHVFERRALDELHRVVEDALRSVAVVEDRDDVRVVQARSALDFVLEARLGVVGHAILTEQLHDGVAPQERVPCAIHLTHAAFTQLVEEGVLPELARGGDFAPEAEDDGRDRDAAPGDDRPPRFDEDGDVGGSQRRMIGRGRDVALVGRP